MQTVLPEDIGLLEFCGRDARAYLQSQLATDLRDLATGSSRHGALLAANGRVLAAGTLYAVDDQSMLWLLHNSLFEDIVPHLKRFVLRSKLAITPRTDLRLSTPHAPNGVYRLTDAAGRQLALASPEHAVTIDGADYAKHGINAGVLDFAKAHADRHLPQAIGLQRTGAIALDKGCYPGQEIVARTHYLGRVKRGLAQYRCDAAPDNSRLVDANNQDIGELLNAVSVDGQTVGLATLQLSADAAWALSESGHRIAIPFEFID